MKNKLKLIAYYRPPCDKSYDRDPFIRHLQTFLENNSKDDCILVGDININAFQRSSYNPNSFPNKYFTLLESFGFTLTNTEITRPITETLLDHVVSNFEG